MLRAIRKSIKRIQLYRDLYDVDLDYDVSRVSSTEDILDARRFQATIYLQRGNIGEHQLNELGVLDQQTDPYVSHSDYFVVRRNHSSPRPIVGASRLINFEQSKRLASFQLFTKTDTYDSALELVDRYGLGCVAEVSGLVKQKDGPLIVPMLLYREMLYHSLDRGIRLWIMVSTDHLYRNLKWMFGDLIKELGPRQQLQLSNNVVIPTGIELDGVRGQLESERPGSSWLRKLILQRMDVFAFQARLPASPPRTRR